MCPTLPRPLRPAASCSPSVRRALPPVGTHSTVLQLGHTTTVWLWLNTVVLWGKQGGERRGGRGERAAVLSTQRQKSSKTVLCRSCLLEVWQRLIQLWEQAAEILLATRQPKLRQRWRQNAATPRAAPPPACASSYRCSTAPLRAPPSHGEAALALHIHEVGVGGGYQALQLVLPLLQLRRGVQQVDVARQHLRAGQSDVASMHKPGNRAPGAQDPFMVPRLQSLRGATAAGCQPPSAHCWPILAPCAAARAPQPARPRGIGSAVAHGACWAVLAAAAGCQTLLPPPEGLPAAACCGPPFPRLHGAASVARTMVADVLAPLLPTAQGKEAGAGAGLALHSPCTPC